MTNDEFCFQRAFAIGKYWPHSFFVRTHSLADLTPPGLDPLPIAVPTHAHEYVHYLHNVSTVAGLHLFVANLWLLRSLPHATDRFGHVSASRHLTIEEQGWVDVGRDWLRGLWGRASWSDGEPCAVRSWQFAPVKPTELLLDLGTSSHRVDLVSIEVRVKMAAGTETKGAIEIGYDLISEGVAYEVDREIRRTNGCAESELDRSIPDYPYLFYRALLDHLIGRQTSPLERIEIGVYALLTSSPAEALVELCRVLGKQVPVSAADTSLPESVVGPVLDQFQGKAMDCIDLMLKPELDALSHAGSSIHAAVEDLYALFRAGFALRTINPILENNFLGRPLDAAGFTSIVGRQLLDCCFLQEGSGGAGRFEWIGPGIVAADQDGVENLARLQAATQFARLHLLSSGAFAPSEQLPATPCLFSGACGVEQTEGSPEVCRTRPWLRFKDAGPSDRVCWYAGGVKCFATKA